MAPMPGSGMSTRIRHGGRGSLAKEAAAHYPRIRRLCPEDVAALEDRIRTALAAG